MLNYIWAGLIIVSLVFALSSDVTDIVQDTYRNDQAIPVDLQFDRDYDPDAQRQPVTVRFDSTALGTLYGSDGPLAIADSLSGTLVKTEDGLDLRVDADAALPEVLATIRDETNPRDQVLQGTVGPLAPEAGLATTAVTFAPVRFVKLGAITTAAIDFAEVAVSIAIGLIGVLVLFLGLSQIAEDAGIIYALVKLVRPILGPLFPEIPKDHPAMGMIALNFAANIFGLGNAATPFGIKAMEELQELNPTEDTATNSMAMFLAINTASIQLIPPVTLIAIIGTETNNVYFPILFTTIGSLIIAITVTKLLQRLPGYRASDPALATATPAPPEAVPPAPEASGDETSTTDPTA